MDPITLPLAVIGITQLVKLAAKDIANIEVKSFYTILIAILAAAAISFIDLDSVIIQNIYLGIGAVGGLTVGVKVGKTIGGTK